MKAEAMANKHRSKKLTSFRREVRSSKFANDKLALKIYGASISPGITGLFINKFSSVLR